MAMRTQIVGSSRIFLVGLAALIASSFAASFAGIYLGSVKAVLELIPGLMILLPPSINMRGSISGVFASRLSSSMHLGEFETDLSRGTVLGDNLAASLVISVLIAFVLGLLAPLAAALFGLPVISTADFVLISVLSGIISSFVVMAITLAVSLLSYRFGLDLDLIAAPTVTTSGDIVTLPILVISSLIIMNLGSEVRFALMILVAVLVLAAGVSVFKLGEAVRAIAREMIPLLIPLCFIGTLAGMTYSLDLDLLVEYAVFLVLIPPYMGGCGSIGGILCSRLATGMHTGAIAPKLLPDREMGPYIFSSYGYALIILPLLGVIAHFASIVLGFNSPGLGLILLITTTAGLLVITLVNIVAYTTATLSFTYGLDPDNFGIPVITSIIDLAGAAVLIWVINYLL
jgi:mgtE-like transporter